MRGFHSLLDAKAKRTITVPNEMMEIRTESVLMCVPHHHSSKYHVTKKRNSGFLCPISDRFCGTTSRNGFTSETL
jgi:hypothetical protein